MGVCTALEIKSAQPHHEIQIFVMNDLNEASRILSVLEPKTGI